MSIATISKPDLDQDIPKQDPISPQIYLGAVYDAMRLCGYRAEEFYIDIKPMAGYSDIVVGPAFTTSGKIVSKNEDYSKLDNIRLDMYKYENFSNKPVVILEANDTYCAHSGDITSKVYQKLGAVGFVTDGMIRDLDIIDKLSFPVFCNGSNPIDAIDYWALTEYNVPVVLNNVDITPGDIMYASRDGVIRVKQQDLEIFNKNMMQVIEKEDTARYLINTLLQQNNTDIPQKLKEFVSQKGRW